jgi:hypothetical protein
MNPEPSQAPGVVPARAPSRAGRAIAFALLTAAGAAIASVLGTILIRRDALQTADPSMARRVWFAVQYSVIVGACIGVAQWLVIRRWVQDLVAGAADRLPEGGRRAVRESAGWIVATIAGWIAAGAFNAAWLWMGRSRSIMEFICRGTFRGAIYGAILGTVQWFFVRRYAGRTGRWIWMTAIA